MPGEVIERKSPLIIEREQNLFRNLHTMDVNGLGSFSTLAAAFRKGLDEIERVRRTAALSRKRFEVPILPLDSSIDPDPLDTALSMNVLRGLADLQTYCESWNGGGFDIHAIPRASGESESTLNMYSSERIFRCPDGETRLFEWHVKRNDIRIHFYPLPASRRVLIGYVGPHLRISSSR